MRGYCFPELRRAVDRGLFAPLSSFLLFPQFLVTPGALVIIVYAHCVTPIYKGNYRSGQAGFTLFNASRYFLKNAFLVILRLWPQVFF